MNRAQKSAVRPGWSSPVAGRLLRYPSAALLSAAAFTGTLGVLLTSSPLLPVAAAGAVALRALRFMLGRTLLQNA